MAGGDFDIGACSFPCPMHTSARMCLLDHTMVSSGLDVPLSDDPKGEMSEVAS